MSVGDWREGEGRTGGRGEHPSSPGPSYSPITKAPSPSAPNNTPKVSFHQAHPKSSHHPSLLPQSPKFVAQIWGLVTLTSQKPLWKKTGWQWEMCNEIFHVKCFCRHSEFDFMALKCQFCMHISFTENASFTMLKMWDKIGIYWFSFLRSWHVESYLEKINLVSGFLKVQI